jgi:hypothetical protein
MRTFRLLISLLSLSFLLSGIALSQDTGQLTGTVKDPSGANVAKAQVTVSNSEKGINRVTQTNSDGEYVVGG